MNIIKLTLAATTITVGLAASASASALPVGNPGSVNAGGIQAEQVRLVCNRWGRCWHVRDYGYRGYRRGYRGRW